MAHRTGQVTSGRGLTWIPSDLTSPFGTPSIKKQAFHLTGQVEGAVAVPEGNDRSGTHPETAEVLVIGAGPSGAFASKRLAEAGFRVVCLEQGDWVDPGRYPGSAPELELVAGREWSFDPNVRALPSDYPVNAADSDVDPLMFNAVGGSSIVFGAHWMRFLPSDFRVRSLDGVADDWPISYEDVRPFYERVDVEMAASGLEGDPAYPPGLAPPLPPLPIGKLGLTAVRGFDKLGWHWWPGSNAIASQAHRSFKPCTLRGTCDWGCPEGAKANVDAAVWPGALHLGVRLVTGARVRELPVDGKGLVTGAIWIDREGDEHFQPAQVVLLAANGVGTPRLLLLSASSRFPDGLANTSGLVGRRLMMHPYAEVYGVFEEDLESWTGPFGQSIYSLEFYESDASRGFVRGAKWAAMPTLGPLSILDRAGWGPVATRWGAGVHTTMREMLGHTIEFGIIAEDLPDEENRVMLDGSLTDADGIPAPKVAYKNSENTRRLLAYHVARATEVVEAAGARRSFSPGIIRGTGWHLLGTARMGDDPTTSVVDRWGQSHDVPNLYIVDGSAFVTSSGLNPTATLCALALRAAEHAVETRRLQKVPA
jgi:choline dehydrogenase-like flavoprotein